MKKQLNASRGLIMLDRGARSSNVSANENNLKSAIRRSLLSQFTIWTFLVNGTHSFIENNTGDLTIITDGSGAGIILDAEDDTVEIKYSGAAGANFGTGGLNIVAGDTYSIGGTAVLSAAGAANIQTGALTGLSALGSGAVDTTNDMLLIYDNDATAYKKYLPIIWELLVQVVVEQIHFRGL